MTNRKNEEVNFYVQDLPKETLDDYVLSNYNKKEIKQTISSMVCPKLYEMHGIHPAKSTLLEGPPGNGKTFLIKCIQGELAKRGKYFGRLDFNLGEVGSSYINENSRRIHDFFDEGIYRIRNDSYDGIIYFFDEADVILTNRGTRQSKEDKKMLETLMKNLQDLHDRNEPEFIFFATNYVGAIDKATMRSGRMDKIITFKNPDEIGRENIFRKQVEILNDNVAYRMVHINNYKKLVSMSDGFNCADCVDIFDKAVRNNIYNAVEKVGEYNVIGAIRLSQKDVEETILEFQKQKYKGDKKEIGFGR